MPSRPGRRRKVIRPARIGVLSVVAICLLSVLAACTSTSPGHASPPQPTSTPTPTSTPPSPTATPRPPTKRPTKAVPKPSKPRSTSARPHAANGPVIVIDPGHSPSIQSVDPSTGLVDSDYANEPEMQDVFDVALLVKAQLQADGYRVVMTKNSASDRVSLGQRAAIANAAHAALAFSIHDQAGSNGGIQFQQGNNIVYYQSVGGYRETPSGKRITFTDSGIAATSMRYGQIFQARRSAAEGHSIRLQGDVGYNLGGRGLAPGDMWMVQLLAKVPWIYDEAGGNSAGMAGLNSSDREKYARGLIASVEQCVPIAR